MVISDYTTYTWHDISICNFKIQFQSTAWDEYVLYFGWKRNIDDTIKKKQPQKPIQKKIVSENVENSMIKIHIGNLNLDADRSIIFHPFIHEENITRWNHILTDRLVIKMIYVCITLSVKAPVDISSI